MLEPGDKIFLMSYKEAWKFAKNDYHIKRCFQNSEIIGINRDVYNEITSRNPHTIRTSSDGEFRLEDEPYVYETWMVKRKINKFYLDNNLFEME